MNDPVDSNDREPEPAAHPRVAVVLPCYKVSRQILGVLERIGPEIDLIYVVDDACPEQTGKLVERSCSDPRVHVLKHARNQGVGGAVLTGYRRALEDEAEIVVKVDGDGQIDPALIGEIIEPIRAGRAEYAKGNRLWDFVALEKMPKIRLLGNSALSFLTKFASGYWDTIDPVNGFTAISRKALKALRLDKIAKDYFFESDILIHLNTIRAVVESVPMPASYGDEPSSLRIGSVLFSFPPRLVKGLLRRIFLLYFIYDFNMASVYMLLGVPLVTFGVVFGAVEWAKSVMLGTVRSAGTIMLVALPIIVGVEMLLQAIAIDINAVPRRQYPTQDNLRR